MPVEDLPASARSCRDAWAEDAQLDRGACHKDWTVLIYMAADVSDLAPFALWNIYDMETPLAKGSAASTVDADVVVQLDLVEPRGIRRMHLVTDDQRGPDAPAPTHELFAGPEALSQLRSPVVELLPDEDDPPADALRDFIDWGLQRYPSENVMLVLWGHGAGWRPSGDPTLAKACPPTPSGSVDFLADGGFGPDCSEGTVLDIPTIAAVLSEHEGVDVLVNDACLMQTVEITTELAEVTRYIVGYEQVAPHAGMPYLRLIPHLNGSMATDPDPSCPDHDAACELAALVPSLYASAVDEGFYRTRTRGTNDAPVAETFAISTVDAVALEDSLVPALDELGDALAEYLAEEPMRGITMYDLLRPGGLAGFEGETRDLGMFLTRLAEAVEHSEALGTSATSDRLVAAIEGSETALERAVLDAAHGSDYHPPDYPEGFAGLSLWLPRCKSSVSARLPDFQRSRFYEILRPAAPWERWLELTLGPQPDCQ